jgi:hypothetical protein
VNDKAIVTKRSHSELQLKKTTYVVIMWMIERSDSGRRGRFHAEEAAGWDYPEALV